ncbi:MAG: type II toxin-antitoxin system VapC family toxin [Chloroflexi bacterium]|nr:type II toxin-antitoxin system VapC family toxin [Chloroflexota bacterium]
MLARIKVFLDSSALFAGIWSVEGGARMILKLGEAGAIRLLVSPQVLAEAEGALRRKAPDALGLLAMLLDRSRAEIVPLPTAEVVERFQPITNHRGDAQVLAAAWSAAADYFVTLDREHFLNNPVLKGAVSFPVGTPGDFLAWYRERLSGE